MSCNRQLILQPDAAGCWRCLEGCTRSSTSDTHILFFSELQILGFSISQLLLALSQRTVLEPSLHLNGHNILNAQVFAQHVIILSYTSQSPFLSVYNLSSSEYAYSGIARVQMFTEESCSRCLDAPGSLFMLDNYVIFNFSRNSPLFACEMTRIDDLDAYFQLGRSGICIPIPDRHQLWIFEQSFLYIHSTSNLLRLIGKQDIGGYEVREQTLKELVLPPITIEKCLKLRRLNHGEYRESLIISLTNKYCFELDVEKKQLTLLTPLLTRESSSSDCYASTTRFLFYFRETMDSKLVLRSLRFTLGSDLSGAVNVPVGYQLCISENGYQRSNQRRLQSLKDALHEAVLNKELQEAIEVCRPDSGVSIPPTQKANLLRAVIARVAQKYACDQSKPTLRTTEMEQKLRALLHKYVERKLRRPHHAGQRMTTKGIYIGTGDVSSATDNKLESAHTHVSAYIATRAYTCAELALAQRAYKRSLCCLSKDICSTGLTHIASPYTHFLTSEPALWSSIITVCNVVTRAGLSILVVLCQYSLYIYLL
ncbi:Hypothetical protein GLP15_4688 [Giardia lamblia P15]|uniref:Uncharacterized protein n=1 Tax=Giardia intestinalis (strain P15) TaxID=658858 RepID=E1F1R6_GIAIA|nr:Hypothetical protein GLP15_4688 [Giardia lamblia P15]